MGRASRPGSRRSTGRRSGRSRRSVRSKRNSQRGKKVMMQMVLPGGAGAGVVCRVKTKEIDSIAVSVFVQKLRQGPCLQVQIQVQAEGK